MRAVSLKRQREGREYAKVRKFVMERDGGCQLYRLQYDSMKDWQIEGSAAWWGIAVSHTCEGPLDPHHIVPAARDVKLRLDPDNLVVLCRRAHDWVHTHPVPATLLGLLKSAPLRAVSVDA